MEPRNQVCGLHGDIMRCLGKLEQGSDHTKEALEKLNEKLDSLIVRFEINQKNNGVNRQTVAVEHAKELAKANIIYWVLGIAGGGLVLSIVNRLFPVVFK